MKREGALLKIYALLIILVLATLWLAMPYLSNNIFAGRLRWCCSDIVGINFVFGKNNGRQFYNFAFDKNGTIYLLSDDKLFSGSNFEDPATMKTISYAGNKLKSNALSECNMPFLPDSKLMVLDQTKEFLYFAFPSDDPAKISVYRLNTRDNSYKEVLEVNKPLLSISANNGNVIVTTLKNVFVSHNNGLNFKDIINVLLNESGTFQESAFYSSIDKANNISFIYSPFLLPNFIYSKDYFKTDFRKTRSMHYLPQKYLHRDILHRRKYSVPVLRGFVFKEVPVNNNDVCFITYPVGIFMDNAIYMPDCFVASVKELKADDPMARINLKEIHIPISITHINDAKVWESHLILATNNGIWVYNFTFRKWYWYGEYRFEVKQMQILKKRLYFFASSSNNVGFYSVDLKSAFLNY